jgi:hypothetical protein
MMTISRAESPPEAAVQTIRDLERVLAERAELIRRLEALSVSGNRLLSELERLVPVERRRAA